MPARRPDLTVLSIALFFSFSAFASGGGTALSSAPTREQEQVALAMVQQLRSCDIGTWETDSDSKSVLADIEASANEPVLKTDFNPSEFALSLTARYVSALNEGVNPSLLSWCRANATLLKFWLAPEFYVKTIAFDGAVLVLYQRLATRGLVGVAFYPVRSPDAKVALQFSVADTTALFDRVAVNTNLWELADAAEVFAIREGASLSIPVTMDEDASEPTWIQKSYSDGDLADSPILPLFASLGDRWAMFSYSQELQDEEEVEMLSKAYEAGVFNAAKSIADIVEDEKDRLLWLERAAKHGDFAASRQFAQLLIEDTDELSGVTFPDCLRVSDAFAAAIEVIRQAPSSEYRDSQLNSAIEGRAFAAARCKALGPERDALVRITDQAMRKSAVDNDRLNLIEAAELCTRGEFNAAALLADKEARARIVLGNCDYFLEQNPRFFAFVCGTGLDEE